MSDEPPSAQDPETEGADAPPVDMPVDQLMELLALDLGQRLPECLGRVVRVRGTVSAVSVWKDRLVYLTLSLGGVSLKARCDIALAPPEGARIVFEGVPTLSPSRFRDGLDVQVVGAPVGAWATAGPGGAGEPAAGRPAAIPPFAPVPLPQLFRNTRPDHLLLLGTKVGINDALHVIGPRCGATRPATRTCVISDSRDILASLRTALKGGTEIKAVALVRGGDDPSIAVLDEPELVAALRSFDLPLYTAVGHAHRVTLADKHADGMYPTPSALGHAIAEAWETAQASRQMAANLAGLRKENDALRQTRSGGVDTLLDRIPGAYRRQAVFALLGLALVGLVSILKAVS